MARQGSHPAPRRRRVILVGVLVSVVLGLLVATVAVVITKPGPVAGWLGDGSADPSASTGTAGPTPSAVLPGATADAAQPTAAGIAAILAPLVADDRLGGRVSVSVLDMRTGTSLYAQGPDNHAVPASTTKLATAVAVLATRGPGYQIATRATAGPNPGEVILIGSGDVTLTGGQAGSYPGAARLDDLAGQVRRALGGTAPTKVIVDSTLFPDSPYGPLWESFVASEGYVGPIAALMTDGGRVNPQVRSPSARHVKPELAAAQAFARQLGLPASAVVPGRLGQPADQTSPGPGSSPDPDGAAAGSDNSAAPAGSSPAPGGSPGLGGPAGTGGSPGPTGGPSPGTELGKVRSLPISQLVEIMLADSDNVVAEGLARQVALAKGQPASFAGAASATKSVLAELGLPAAEIGVVDGSGMSRGNWLTPSVLTDMLVLAARPDRPDLHGIFAGLPVAGYSGTLRDRYRSPGPARPGAGVVRAKTGTLAGVNAIAGIVVTREGRLLAFAIMADKTTAGQYAAQDGLDALAGALAGCGCR